MLVEAQPGEMVIVRKEKRRREDEKEDSRGSGFRGVSKNGLHWQIFMNVDGGSRRYRGCLPSEQASALLYDKAAVQYQGRSAQTNFDYSREEVVEMVFSDLVFKTDRDPAKQEQAEPELLSDWLFQWKQKQSERTDSPSSSPPSETPYLPKGSS